MNKLAAAAVAFSLALAACGVSRDSDDVTAAPADDENADVEDNLDADTDVEDNLDADTEEGADGDDGSDQTETTLAPPETTPPTTGAPGEVALEAEFGETEFSLTHGELNEIIIPTVENEEFVALVFGGGRPPGFDAGVLSEFVVSEAVRAELEDLGVSITDEDLSTSKESLLVAVGDLFGGQPDAAEQAEALYEEVPYLPFLAEYQARQDKLTDALSTDADPDTGVPCVRHILLETEADADQVLVDLEGGADFGELAMERSTGPSGPSGGELGCAPSSGYVPEFAAAVDEAELGQYIGPVETEFGFHVLVVDNFEVDGQALATEALRARLGEATVEVDPAVGIWDPGQLSITPAQ